MKFSAMTIFIIIWTCNENVSISRANFLPLARALLGPGNWSSASAPPRHETHSGWNHHSASKQSNPKSVLPTLSIQWSQMPHQFQRKMMNKLQPMTVMHPGPLHVYMTPPCWPHANSVGTDLQTRSLPLFPQSDMAPCSQFGWTCWEP